MDRLRGQTNGIPNGGAFWAKPLVPGAASSEDVTGGCDCLPIGKGAQPMTCPHPTHTAPLGLQDLADGFHGVLCNCADCGSTVTVAEVATVRAPRLGPLTLRVRMLRLEQEAAGAA